MEIANHELLLPFVPRDGNPDHFIYTEMLDRGKRKGNNGVRLVKTFYHRTPEEFQEQVPIIQQLCRLAGVRAYTRLSTRSFKRVGVFFTKAVVEAALSDNWAGMKTLYNHSCGSAGVVNKYWLLDIDDPAFLEPMEKQFKGTEYYEATIPTKKGYHIIVKPFRQNVDKPDPLRGIFIPHEITVHKDNPTLLFCPENAV